MIDLLPYFIIEHPRKGILMDWMEDYPSGWKFKWSWSKNRPEAHRFHELRTARAVFDLMPSKIKLEAYILEGPDFKREVKHYAS